MNSPTCSLVILTRFHSITADLELQGRRLSELLNDDRESALRVSNAQVARLANPAAIIAQHAASLVLKHQIIIAFERQPVQATASRRFYGYIKKNQHHVFVVTDGIEVRGLIHTTDSFEIGDIHHFITMRREMFLPVTQTRVTFCDDERFVIEQDAIMLNVHRIHYIARA